MFGSTLLDVAIGLVLIYFVLSVTCSAAVELWAGITRGRAINFRAAICNLLADKAGPSSTPESTAQTETDSDAVGQFKAHPLVASISGQKIGKHFKKDAGWPSYMDARTFSSVIFDLLAPKQLPINQQHNFWAIRAALAAPETLPRKLESPSEKVWAINGNLESILKTFIAVAEAHFSEANDESDANRLALFRSQIEVWFEEGMDRAGGWYKQKAQVHLFVIALAITVLLNVDTVRIARQLYSDPGARNGLVAMAQSTASTQPITNSQISGVVDQWKDVNAAGIPIGWTSESFNPLTKVGGLLLSAMAVSLGAPFWFDMLNKLVSVRASGTKPEKSDAAQTLKDLTKPEDDSEITALPQVAGGIRSTAVVTAVPSPPAALILPTNYWSLPIRKSDLTKFDRAATTYSAANAAVMAKASMLAYLDEPQLRRTLATAWDVQEKDSSGGDNIRVFRADDQQGFAFIHGEAVILAFRGTVPQILNTILADAGICLVTCPFGSEHGLVHCGFLGALDAIKEQIDAFLNQHLQKTLFITGHSLGAAMGTLYAAKRLWIDNVQTVGGLYTFGSPRVGDIQFVRDLNAKLIGKSFRLINEEDLVTRVAPRELNYDHLNAAMFLDKSGQLETDGIGWSRFLNTVVNALNDFKVEAESSIYDHHIELYVRKLDNLCSI